MPPKRHQIGRQTKRTRFSNASSQQSRQKRSGVTRNMNEKPSSSMTLCTPPPPEPHRHQGDNILINTTISPSSAATSLSSLTTASGLSSINTDDLSQADSSSTSSASRYNSANLSSTQRKAIKNDIHSIVTLLTHNKSHAAQQYMLHTLNPQQLTRVVILYYITQ